MKKALLALMLAGAAVAGVSGTASAQGVYFGFGGGGYEGHHGWGHEGWRHRGYGYGYAAPYAAYGYGGCYYQTRRHFNEYRGVWVVRRVRVCD